MNSKIMIVILLIIVGGGGFFAGLKYQTGKAITANFQQRQMGNSFRQRLGQNFRPVRGDIIGRDDKSITVKLPDGSSKIILFSDKTVYLKSSTGSKDDLKTGDKVMVIGTENSDGSVTAQDVQINPPISNFNRTQ